MFTVLPFLCSADDEAMATEVTPPASAELTELGQCLMKQEVRVHALISTLLSLYFLSHFVTQLDAVTEMEAAGTFPSARIFSWEHTCFLRALLMVAEATKEMEVGIQYNRQLQSSSPSVDKAIGIQPPGCSLALPSSWTLAFMRKNFTQQLFFSVKSARAGTGATGLT